MCLDSSVGTAKEYGLDDPAIVRDFSLLYIALTNSRAYPASYPMGTGGDFPGGKVARA
jgi:hypothetical protein